MKTLTPAAQLAGFIAKFSPEVAAVIKASRTKMRRRLPHANELVYDNYNFFVIGYAPAERSSEAVFSIAAHARGVALCFLHGAKLPDPKKSCTVPATKSAASVSPPPQPSTIPTSKP